MTSKVQEFLDSLSETTDTDLILAIVGKPPCQSISRNMIDIQSIMYDLSEKYPILQERFKFNTSGIYPYSEELDRAIYRLEWAEALGAVNPGYASYQINQKQAEESRKKFPPGELKEIDKISREFQERLGACVCQG